MDQKALNQIRSKDLLMDLVQNVVNLEMKDNEIIREIITNDELTQKLTGGRNFSEMAKTNLYVFISNLIFSEIHHDYENTFKPLVNELFER